MKPGVPVTSLAAYAESVGAVATIVGAAADLTRDGSVAPVLANMACASGESILTEAVGALAYCVPAYCVPEMGAGACSAAA